MELSYATIEKVIRKCGEDNWQTCSEYGEPGYSHSSTATTPLIVLGDYWCRCDKIEGLHSFDQHHPAIWRQMETQGVEFEWCDEWDINYECDKAYRVSGDSYGWQPSLIYTDEGDMLTPDDDLDTWLEWAIDQPTKCLPSRVWSKSDLIEAGFESWNGEYESGWHPGQTDDPNTITREVRAEKGESVEIVFLLDKASQFYIGFSAWIRDRDTDNESDEA